MPDEAPRSRAARAAAEQALIRVAHHPTGVSDTSCAQIRTAHDPTAGRPGLVPLEVTVPGYPECGQADLPRGRSGTWADAARYEARGPRPS